MQVTNITVGYDRKRQPAQYESAGARVEFSATVSVTVGDNENHVAAATRLLGEAKTIVLTELGIIAAGQSASAPVIAAAAATAASAKPAETVKETAAQKKAREKAEKATASEAPGSEAMQIHTNGENRVDPAQAAASEIPDGSGAPATTAATGDRGIPEDPPAGTASTQAPKLTATELHGYIAEQIKAQKIDQPSVKEISRGKPFNVERIADLKEDMLPAYKKAIDDRIAALSGGGGGPDI